MNKLDSRRTAASLSHRNDLSLEKFDKQLSEWEACLNIVMSNKQLGEKGCDPKFTYSKYMGRLHKAGINTWSESLCMEPHCKGDRHHFRDHFIPALRVNVAAVFNRFVAKDHASVLELGSNKVDAQGESFLSNLLPDRYKCDLTLSDHYAYIVDQERGKSTRTYLQVNAKKIGETIASGSKDVIVSLNVMDVINRKKIVKVAQSSFEVLKNGGHLIILNEKQVCPHILLEKYSSADSLAMFWLDYSEDNNGYAIGIKYAPNHLVKERIRNSVLPEEYSGFLDRFFALNPLQMQEFLTNCYRKHFQIFDFLDLFFPPEHTSYVEEEASYFQDMKEALNAAGFRVLSMTKEVGEANVASFTSASNFVEMDMGRVKFYNRHQQDIPESQTKVVSNLLAIVAQKV